MEIRSSWQSHPVFDVENRIIETGNHPCPIDLAPFQRRLDQIAGMTSTGHSLLRLEWGQDWFGARMIVCGSWRLKHVFYRGSRRHEFYNPISKLIEIEDEMFEIGIPRFFITELHTLAELNDGDAWQKARHHWQDGELLDVLGPIPEEGFYTTLFTIAHHDSLCCGGREHRKGVPCLGSYREPNERDLERIERMKWERDHASNDVLVPSEELVKKHRAEFREKRDAHWQERIDGAINDYVNTRKHSWTTLDPGALSWGKYHFTAGHSRSGASIITPKENNDSSDSSADSTGLPDSE